MSQNFMYYKTQGIVVMAKFGIVPTRLPDLGVRIKVACKRDLVFSAIKWNNKNMCYNSFSYFFFVQKKHLLYTKLQVTLPFKF